MKALLRLRLHVVLCPVSLKVVVQPSLEERGPDDLQFQADGCDNPSGGDVGWSYLRLGLQCQSGIAGS